MGTLKTYFGVIAIVAFALYGVAGMVSDDFKRGIAGVLLAGVNALLLL